MTRLSLCLLTGAGELHDACAEENDSREDEAREPEGESAYRKMPREFGAYAQGGRELEAKT
jgi:hypothetical protein